MEPRDNSDVSIMIYADSLEDVGIDTTELRDTNIDNTNNKWVYEYGGGGGGGGIGGVGGGGVGVGGDVGVGGGVGIGGSVGVGGGVGSSGGVGGGVC